MYYLDSSHIASLPLDWPALTTTIRHAAAAVSNGTYVQPLKPYLRFGDPVNRIIAMPAYIGEGFDVAGIKWIASFPNNIKKGILRANSVTILNEAATGVPFCIINSPLVSGIRTAAVSGLILEEVTRYRSPEKRFRVGITGFGPIGRLHLQMVDALLGERVTAYDIYDVNGVETDSIPTHLKEKVTVCNNYETAFNDADIFITATVATKRYITGKPVQGSLQLNVSLRDYDSSIRQHINRMLVDNWEEVCRENTDIHCMHEAGLLQQEDTLDLADIFGGNRLADLRPDETVMFNPMGMAIFDMAIAHYFYHYAREMKTGIALGETLATEA
ncbi:2,3-diaminopropionate biosynthesis protein SbnB [Chitinophaga sp. Mgbs1]|uniref:2,3-diaminopropionate biosynthesis protein SbnB n=1 Tax=Chitinophaga solisilvae TaxID=1233460 RepID=A0A3S1CU49_9BACT|nr:2,3-diaminopropionate biosynthesis protein SbnB [Chitinophaga solisilvae]